MLSSSSGQNDFPGIFALPGIRRDLSPGEAPEVYTVEEGDTMYDICDQLIDDGSYWPKLWSLNTEVKNPHFIYPGMRLAFYAGDTENPPRIEVVSEDEAKDAKHARCFSVSHGCRLFPSGRPRKPKRKNNLR